MPDANGNPTQDDLNLANDLLTNLQARKNMSVDLSRLALQIKDTALADKLLEVQKNAEMLKATNLVWLQEMNLTSLKRKLRLTFKLRIH